MDDKYYFKTLASVYELEYLAAEISKVNGGLKTLVPDENKRISIKNNLKRIKKAVAIIEATSGEEINPEFPELMNSGEDRNV